MRFGYISHIRGKSRISRNKREFRCINALGFALLIFFFFNIPWKRNNLVSLRPNYFIFIGYLKTGREEGFKRTPLDPPLHMYNHSLYVYVQLSVWAKVLNSCLDLYLYPYFVLASSEGSGEIVHLHRLI